MAVGVLWNIMLWGWLSDCGTLVKVEGIMKKEGQNFKGKPQAVKLCLGHHFVIHRS